MIMKFCLPNPFTKKGNLKQPVINPVTFLFLCPLVPPLKESNFEMITLFRYQNAIFRVVFLFVCFCKNTPLWLIRMFILFSGMKYCPIPKPKIQSIWVSDRAVKRHCLVSTDTLRARGRPGVGLVGELGKPPC